MSEEQIELDKLAAEAEAEEVQGGEYIPGQGEQAEPEPAGPATGEIIAPILQITFGLIASRRGAHWALTDQEAIEAGNAYGAVMDKYFPDAPMGPEVTAVIVTLAIVGPRVGEDKRKAAAAEKEGGQSGEESERGEGE